MNKRFSMRAPVVVAFLLGFVVSGIAARAQSPGVLDLSGLAALEAAAEETVSISLDPSTMDLAKAFLSGQHALEEEAALRVLDGLESLQVRVFEFAGNDGYSDSDVAPIYAQLNGPNWSKVLSVDEADEKVGAWVMSNGNGIGGLGLIVEDGDELVVVNVVGMVTLEDLVALSSQFQIPFPTEFPGDLPDSEDNGN